MSTRINHNILSMTAQRHIGQAQSSIDTAVGRLSSGLRINNSWEDAAGLAVSEKFRAQIGGMTEAERNANYNINLLATAEGSLQVIDEKLIRMRALAVQASNGALESKDREYINVEFQQLKKEITRIANVTNYNNVKLINGDLSTGNAGSSSGNMTSVNDNSSNIKFHIGANNIQGEDYYYVNIGGATASALGLDGSSGTQMTEADYASENNLTQTGGPYNFNNAHVYSTAPADVVNQFSPTAQTNFYVNQAGNRGYYFLNDTSGDLHVLETDGVGNVTFYGDTNLSQSGSAAADVLTTASAQQAIDLIDAAIESKDTTRAFIGSMVERLQNNILQLQISKESAQASESMIRDADIASEMSQFTRAQILFNSGISMLSQANSVPQMVAQLIG